jgi:hypothetical protein
MRLAKWLVAVAVGGGIGGVVAGLAACHPKGDQDDQCHDIVAHMRKVSTMPMRDGDVDMLMGACMMWKPAMMDCMVATTNDADIAKCRAMEK